MTKTLDAALLTQAQSDVHAPVVLVEIDDWGGADVSWANTLKTVQPPGRDYQPRALSVTTISLDTSGKPQEVTISVDNRDLGVTDLIDTANPKGNKFVGTAAAVVAVKKVFLNDLTVMWTMASDLDVKSYRVAEDFVQFYCRGVSSFLDQRVPHRLFSRTCWKEFKSTACGASSGDFCSVSGSTPHEYTLEACIARSNKPNFGGFTMVLPKGLR